jgi:hypothetical protein
MEPAHLVPMTREHVGQVAGPRNASREMPSQSTPTRYNRRLFQFEPSLRSPSNRHAPAHLATARRDVPRADLGCLEANGPVARWSTFCMPSFAGAQKGQASRLFPSSPTSPAAQAIPSPNRNMVCVLPELSVCDVILKSTDRHQDHLVHRQGPPVPDLARLHRQ